MTVNWNAPEFWIDGGCLGNNDPHGKREAYGSISDGKAIMRRRFARVRTNNEAEYMTLLASLKNILMLRTDPNGPMIYTDSQLTVGQLTQGSKVKAQNLLSLHEQAALLLAKTKVKLVWLTRPKIVEKLGH
jgi:ribonuclease HI